MVMSLTLQEKRAFIFTEERFKLVALDAWNGIILAVDFYPRPVLAFGYCRCLRLSVCVRQPSACPRDNLSPIQSRITKFGPEVQNNLVKIPIVFGLDWP